MFVTVQRNKEFDILKVPVSIRALCDGTEGKDTLQLNLSSYQAPDRRIIVHS